MNSKKTTSRNKLKPSQKLKQGTSSSHFEVLTEREMKELREDKKQKVKRIITFLSIKIIIIVVSVWVLITVYKLIIKFFIAIWKLILEPSGFPF